MPYIIKDKLNNCYSIIQDLDDEIIDFKYFKIDDELIAIPIQKLCNKGYITECSCSAHPYSEIIYSCSDKKEDSNYFFDDNMDCYVSYSLVNQYRESYISFKENINFKELPEGWIYKNKAIRRTYDDSLDELSFYEQVINEMKKLSNWIDTLPDYKK